MNWEDFFAGKISVYCGDRTGAEQFFDECDAHGIPTLDQRRKLKRYGTSHRGFALRRHTKQERPDRHAGRPFVKQLFDRRFLWTQL